MSTHLKRVADLEQQRKQIWRELRDSLRDEDGDSRLLVQLHQIAVALAQEWADIRAERNEPVDITNKIIRSKLHFGDGSVADIDEHAHGLFELCKGSHRYR